MSSLHSQNLNFSPARAASPHIWTNPDVDIACSQYLAQLLAEHQKLGPFLQVLPICSCLLNQGFQQMRLNQPDLTPQIKSRQLAMDLKETLANTSSSIMVM